MLKKNNKIIMPLKIIHHKEKMIKKNKDNSLKESLVKMLVFCKNIVNILNDIISKENFAMDLFNKIESDYYNQKDKNKKDKNIINSFHFIAGDKLTPLDVLLKITSIMQKVNILANNFGVSLLEDDNESEDILTDEDIDIMVQMVKDFGEKQLREDVKECREKIINQKEVSKNKENDIDVYDVYYNNLANN